MTFIILYHTLDKDWDQASINCRNTYYLNGTKGVTHIVDSIKPIEIRVIHEMESVELRVEQDADSGVVRKLNCFSVGGYPTTTQFKFVIDGAHIEKESIVGTRLEREQQLTCIGIWEGSDSNNSKEKSSKIYTSNYKGHQIINENLKSGDLTDGDNTAAFGGNIMLVVIIVFVVGTAIFLFSQKDRLVNCIAGGKNDKGHMQEETEEDPLNSKESTSVDTQKVGDPEAGL